VRYGRQIYPWTTLNGACRIVGITAGCGAGHLRSLHRKRFVELLVISLNS
jgi:hypothetical protein